MQMRAKLEKFIFYLFIFCVPFQTRIILKTWGESFNEWSTAFLYGTDILLLILFIFWLIRVVQRRSIHKQGWTLVVDNFSLADKIFLVFIGLAAFSISQAGNKFLSFYSWIKLLEMAGLYFYIKSSAGVAFTVKGLIQTVVLSGFFQSIIAVTQIFYQRSLDLKILGESFLRPNFSGVAVVPVLGEKFLRAYGTLPHPNLLAIFLVWTIFLAIFLYLSSHSYQSKVGPWLSISIIYPVSLLALLLTFSRTVIGISFLVSIIYFLIVLRNSSLKKNLYFLRFKIIRLFSISGLVLIVFVTLFTPQVISRLQISLDDQAVQERGFYNSVGMEVITGQAWLGVGMGNFVSWFQNNNRGLSSWVYQPIHNIYLLIASEIGLIGLILFLSFLFLLLNKHWHFFWFPLLFIFLAIGLFDHFFWTLQQGQLIFWMTLGLMAASKNQEK